MERIAAAFGGTYRSRAFDEDAAHHARRHTQEVSSVLPRHFCAGQPQVRLVDE
jgi:hypothetical protein